MYFRLRLEIILFYFSRNQFYFWVKNLVGAEFLKIKKNKIGCIKEFHTIVKVRTTYLLYSCNISRAAMYLPQFPYLWPFSVQLISSFSTKTIFSLFWPTFLILAKDLLPQWQSNNFFYYSNIDLKKIKLQKWFLNITWKWNK